ncbi:NAD-dependent epimerase/dehydratase family protein [Lachnospiraceae bacterium 62-26]
MKILVTGGTTFVSKSIAEYLVNKNNEIYVLNRGTRQQVEGVHLIRADRSSLENQLSNIEFDVIIDVNAYKEKDITNLLQSGVKFSEYIFISSGAVYPEYGIQPFREIGEIAENYFWGNYGKNKIAAERVLENIKQRTYILRPCYLYGPYNNIYRESFVFDCAMNRRKFYIPGNGSMKLQFFYVSDICRFIEILLKDRPEQRVFNIGNTQRISVKEWVDLCYQIVGETVEYVQVSGSVPQKNYFPFPKFEYELDVSRLSEWIKNTTDIYQGLQQSYEWYRENQSEVRKKNYIEYIDKEWKHCG